MEEAQIGRTDPSNPVATAVLRLNTQPGAGYIGSGVGSPATAIHPIHNLLVKHLGQCLKDIGHDHAGLAHCVSRPKMRFGWCPSSPVRELRSATTHKHSRIWE